MSTKIYNAWEWNESLDDLIKWFNSIKLNQYFQDCLNLVRKTRPHDDEDRWKYERRIYKELLDAKNSDEKSFLDVDLSCVVIQHSNKIVVCFFGLSDYVFPTVQKEIYSKFKYFGWWDNSDPQEGISEEEWNYRKDWYDEVFAKYESETYSEIGLCYEFSSKTMMFKVCDQVAKEKHVRSSK